MSLARRIAHNTIIQYAAKSVGTVLGLVTIGFITRYLGQEGFGYYTTIMGFLQFFGILVDFGLSLTTAQMLGHSKWNEDQLFSNILSLRVISAAIFLGIAPLVVFAFPYPSFVKVGVAITAFSFFFMSISQIFLGFYQKHLSLQYASFAEIGNRIFLLVAIILATSLHWGLFGVLVSVILSNAVQVILLVIPARKFTRLSFQVNWEVYKDIWSKTWPIAVSIALNLLYLKTDIIVLSLFRSPAEVGLYGAAYKVVDVLTTFPVLFAGLLLPLLSRYWQTSDKERFRQLVQQGFDAMSLLAWPIMVGTVFVAGDVMALIAGEAFRASGILLQLLIWASGVIFFNAVFAHAIVALNRQKSTIWAYAAAAIIGVVGYFVFIPPYGPIGAAVMTVITETVVMLLIFSLFVRYSGIWPSFKRWGGALFACAVMAVVLVLTSHIAYGWRIILGAVTYGVVLLLTKTVSKHFLRDLVTFRRYQNEA